jgi:hypothetical protein
MLREGLVVLRLDGGWVVVMGTRCYWCPYVSEEDKREINRVRFALTKVLKEFNKQNSRYVAWLYVIMCSPMICGDRVVFYRVVVRRRDKSKVVTVDILFSYNLDKDRRAFIGIDGHWQSLDPDGVCELALDLTRDISVLAMRLNEVFTVGFGGGG